VGDVWDQAANGLKSHVSVTRAKMKGGRGRHRKSITSRTVPLNDAALAILQKYLFSRFGSGPVVTGEPLFPSRFHGIRLTRWTANIIVHRVLDRAGLGNREYYGSHSLRKTFCKNIYQLTKFDINLTRAVMGHANIATTQKYLVVEAADIQDAILLLGSGGGRRTLRVAAAAGR
jgi:integrase